MSLQTRRHAGLPQLAQGMEQGIQPLIVDERTGITDGERLCGQMRWADASGIHAVGQQVQAVFGNAPMLPGIAAELGGNDEDPVGMCRHKAFQRKAELEIVRLCKGWLPRNAGQLPQAAHLVLEGDAQTSGGQERGQGIDMVGCGMDMGHALLPGITLQHSGRLRRIDGSEAVVARSAGMDIAYAVPQCAFRFRQAKAVAPVPGIARAGDDAQIRAALFQSA